MFNILLFILTISLSISSYALTRDYIPDEHPNSRYSVHNNGTVTDNITGLMWKVCSEGQTWANNTCTGTGNASAHNWQAALEQAESEDFATHSDWRLPNIRELKSILAYNRYSPSINEVIFPNNSTGTFWSSSPSAHTTAWKLEFDSGSDDEKGRTTDYRVRLVRLGH